MADPIPGRMPKVVGASEAMQSIKSNEDIWIHGFASSPTTLLNALCDHVLSSDLKNIRLHHFLIPGEVRWLQEKFYCEIFAFPDHRNFIFSPNPQQQPVRRWEFPPGGRRRPRRRHVHISVRMSEIVQ